MLTFSEQDKKFKLIFINLSFTTSTIHSVWPPLFFTSHGNTKDTPSLKDTPLPNRIFLATQNIYLRKPIKNQMSKDTPPFDVQEIGQKGGVSLVLPWDTEGVTKTCIISEKYSEIFSPTNCKIWPATGLAWIQNYVFLSYEKICLQIYFIPKDFPLP